MAVDHRTPSSLSLAAHNSEFRRWSGGVDHRICQTFAASPAEPGDLPLGFRMEVQVMDARHFVVMDCQRFTGARVTAITKSAICMQSVIGITARLKTVVQRGCAKRLGFRSNQLTKRISS